MRCSAHTMPDSDSSTACAWGVRLAPSPTGPRFAAGAAEVSRFSCGEFPGVPGFPRPRRARSPLANARRTMWPSPSVHRVGARYSGFRGSIAGPPVPLSTLHPRCRHRRRMTRGQRGSLPLHCGALSSPALRRPIPALSDSYLVLAEQFGLPAPFLQYQVTVPLRMDSCRPAQWRCGPTIPARGSSRLSSAHVLVALH
jgi:hypothetical protein